ncbi:MAG: zinc-binding dehydrogenase, partial [Bryobacteraceae bacterium]
VGPAVRMLKPGDLVVPAIRRPCTPQCPLCLKHRTDLCVSGAYRERGIFGLHGYLCEFAADSERYLHRVPASVAEFAVVTEPLSVVEKAVATALRLREEPAATALVFGAGPIGLLAALVLQLRGIETTVQSLESPGHARARIVERAGMHYLQTGQTPHAPVDIAIEATGSPEASFAAIRSLASLGVCVLLGASEGHGDVSFTNLVTRNQRIAGSVNASPASFKAAIEDLPSLDPGLLRSLIERVPFTEFPRTISTGVALSSAKLVHVLN